MEGETEEFQITEVLSSCNSPLLHCTKHIVTSLQDIQTGQGWKESLNCPVGKPHKHYFSQMVR